MRRQAKLVGLWRFSVAMVPYWSAFLLVWFFAISVLLLQEIDWSATDVVELVLFVAALIGALTGLLAIARTWSMVPKSIEVADDGTLVLQMQFRRLIRIRPNEIESVIARMVPVPRFGAKKMRFNGRTVYLGEYDYLHEVLAHVKRENPNVDFHGV